MYFKLKMAFAVYSYNQKFEEIKRTGCRGLLQTIILFLILRALYKERGNDSNVVQNIIS